MDSSARLVPPAASLLGLPAELRIKIYRMLFQDLISELSDYLYAVLQVYDHTYNYTMGYLENHVGNTGLTPILQACRQTYGEALPVLCEHTEFVVSLMGDHDEDDEERAHVRFPEGSRHLEFARDLKVNFLPEDDHLTDRYIGRIEKFLGAINDGANLRSLKVFFGVNAARPIEAESISRILDVLTTLKTQGGPIKVYLGDVNEEQLGDERLAKFLDAIHGDCIGRNQAELGPRQWEYDSEGESE